MTFWRMFWAVVFGNIVSWFVISVIGWIVWALFFNAIVSGVGDRIENHRSSITPPVTIQRDAPQPNASGSTSGMSPWNLKPIQEQSKRFVEHALSQHKPPKKKKLAASSSVIAQNKRMCEFWGKEYRKDPNSKYEAYRENACLRYRKSLTTYK